MHADCRQALLGKPRASTMSCSDDVEVLTFNADELHLHLRPDGVAKVRQQLFVITEVIRMAKVRQL